MKYSFMIKISFLAFGVATLTPCYLLAVGGKDDSNKEEKPSRAVAAPTQNPSSALDQNAVGADEGEQAAIVPGASPVSGSIVITDHKELAVTEALRGNSEDAQGALPQLIAQRGQAQFRSQGTVKPQAAGNSGPTNRFKNKRAF